MICTKFVFIFLEYLEYEKDWLGSHFVNDFISTGIFNDEVPEITQLRLFYKILLINLIKEFYKILQNYYKSFKHLFY